MWVNRKMYQRLHQLEKDKDTVTNKAKRLARTTTFQVHAAKVKTENTNYFLRDAKKQNHAINIFMKTVYKKSSPQTEVGQLQTFTNQLATQHQLPSLTVIAVKDNTAFCLPMQKKNYVIAIGTTLFKVLTVEQLKAVIAHEIGHIILSKKYHMNQFFYPSKKNAYWSTVSDYFINNIFDSLLIASFVDTIVLSLTYLYFGYVSLFTALIVALISIPVLLVYAHFNYRYLKVANGLNYFALTNWHQHDEELADKIGAKLYSARLLASALWTIASHQAKNDSHKYHHRIAVNTEDLGDVRDRVKHLKRLSNLKQ